MLMDWLNKYINDVDNFPRPNWEAICSYVEKNLKDAEPHDLWCKIARIWVAQLKAKLPAEYAIHE